MENKETRAFLCKFETRQNDEHGTFIEGVPIVFNRETDLGSWKEIIDEGALDGADLRDIRLLVNHDTNQLPLARSRNNNANSTMQFTVESDGMHMRADLDIQNNARAAELYSAVKRGDVSGMSFMFQVNGDKWENLDEEVPTRHITSIGKVYEVSAVTFPAYEATSVNARSLDCGKASLESARKALESAKQRANRIAELNKKLEEMKND